MKEAGSLTELMPRRSKNTRMDDWEENLLTQKDPLKREPSPATIDRYVFTYGAENSNRTD